jgi:hypothetical protein
MKAPPAVPELIQGDLVGIGSSLASSARDLRGVLVDLSRLAVSPPPIRMRMRMEMLLNFPVLKEVAQCSHEETGIALSEPKQ